LIYLLKFIVKVNGGAKVACEEGCGWLVVGVVAEFECSFSGWWFGAYV